MTFGIPISNTMLKALQDRNKRYLRVRIVYESTDVDLYPVNISSQASEDYQKWSIELKNYGEYQEGLFANCAATVSFSHDNSEWVQIFKGYVSSEGMGRTIGFITDDHVSFDLVDLTKWKGVKRTPSSAVFAGLKICDPTDTDNSILHRLGSLMGITSFDCAPISDVKDIVVIGQNTVWAELKLLRDAFSASMYFDYLGRLRFRSFQDSAWVDPDSEWTFVGDPSYELTDSSSPILGKINPTYNEVICNRSSSSLDVYDHRSLRVIFRDTTDWDSDLETCHIEIAAGETYPDSGVTSLSYQDPDTGEEYPYATGVITPTVGQNTTYDICYIGGSLELVSFNGSTSDTSQQPDASQIILKNNGSQTAVITKLTVRGEPFVLTTEQTVEEVDAAITDEIDYVDDDVDGTYATSVTQIDQVLAKKVSQGKDRTRHFSFSTIFLPLLQRGMYCKVILSGGEEVSCKLLTYSHQMTGKTLATLRTSVVLDEVIAFVPTYNPKVINTASTTAVPKKGDSGASVKGITLSATRQIINITSRGVVYGTDILIEAVLQNLSGSPDWQVYDGIGSLIGSDELMRTLDISSVNTDTITIRATVDGYVGEIGFVKVSDGKPSALYFGKYSEIPTNTPDGDILITGDFFFYVGASITDSYQYGHIYKYSTITGNWSSTVGSYELGVAAKDAFAEARSTGNYVYAAVVYAQNVIAANIQAGPGTGSAGSGFRFRAMSDNIGDGTGTALFDVYIGDNKLFGVDIDTGKIYFGEYFWYNPSDGAIHTQDDKTVIKSDGTIEAIDGNFSGTMNALTGFFGGTLDTPAFSSLPSSEGTSLVISESASAQSQCTSTYNSVYGVLAEDSFYACTHSSNSTVKYLAHRGSWPSNVGDSWEIDFYNSSMVKIGSMKVTRAYFVGLQYSSTYSSSSFTLTTIYGVGDVFKFKDLPTVSTGLASGQIWRDGVYLKIIP
jgi:hypothetical protein